MTNTELISILNKYPDNTEVLLWNNNKYCETLSNDIKFIHKSKINEIVLDQQNIDMNKSDYICCIK